MALTGSQVNVSASGQALTASAIEAETLIIKAHQTNDEPVYIGQSGITTSTGYPIYPGEEFVFTPAHGNLQRTPKPCNVYVIGSAGDKVSWLGTRK